MSKKAQVTTFMIVGLILIITVLTIVYYTSQAEEAVAEKEAEKAALPAEVLDEFALSSLVRSCIANERQAFEKIGEFGGFLLQQEGRHRKYNTTYYNYHCSIRPGFDKCTNNLVSRKEMENTLESNIKNRVKQCIDLSLSKFEEQGYNIQKGNYELKVSIAVDDISVKVNYLMTIVRDSTTIKSGEFGATFQYPLGRMYDLANEILNSELRNGYFDQVKWIKEHGAEVVIEKHKPYPDILYKLKKLNPETREIYFFNFGLQGKDKMKNLANPEPQPSPDPDAFLGCCYLADGNVYENTQEDLCTGEFKKGLCDLGRYFPAASFEEKELCNGFPCKSCEKTYSHEDDPANREKWTGPLRKHSESWCVYEGPTGNGRDFVGSRHYRHYCANGVEYVEECGDFRTELCAEEQNNVNGYNFRTAICRPNRWQECHSITNKEECLDREKRDCSWSDLQDQVISYGDLNPPPQTKEQTRKCIPEVAPGLMFWDTASANDVCNWGNDVRECDQTDCPQKWTDFTALYCSQLGDCGVSRNLNGRLNRERISGIGASIDNTLFTPSFTTFPNQIHQNVFERIFPSQDAAWDEYSYKLNLPVSPSKRDPVEITKGMFINPGYTHKDISVFVQKYAEWVKNLDIGMFMWQLAFGEKIELYTVGASVCNAWSAPNRIDDCGVCNNNPLRPCTPYRCYSLGRSCFYEEDENGVGLCSFGTADDRSYYIKFKSQISEGYETERTFLSSFEGLTVTPPLFSDYAFEIETVDAGGNPVATQCMLTTMPNMDIKYAQTLPGTNIDYTFSSAHRMGIPYNSVEVLQTLLLPLDAMAGIFPINVDNIQRRYEEELERIKKDTLEEYDKCVEKLGDDCKMDPNKVIKELDENKRIFKEEILPTLRDTLGYAAQNAIEDILMSAVDPRNEYHAFITCRDKNGKRQVGGVTFIRFKINPNPPFTLPLVDTAPEIYAFSAADKGAGIVSLQAYVSELAECYYNIGSDAEINTMLSSPMQCDSSLYDALAGYLCHEDFTQEEISSKVYVKCIDHPEHYESYSIKLRKSEDFNVVGDPSGFVLRENEGNNRITVRDLSKINISQKTIGVNTEAVEVVLNMSAIGEEAECRYANDDIGFDSMTLKFTQLGGITTICTECFAGFAAPADETDVYIKCRFATSPENRNIMKESEVYPEES